MTADYVSEAPNPPSLSKTLSKFASVAYQGDPCVAGFLQQYDPNRRPTAKLRRRSRLGPFAKRQCRRWRLMRPHRVRPRRVNDEIISVASSSSTSSASGRFWRCSICDDNCQLEAPTCRHCNRRLCDLCAIWFLGDVVYASCPAHIMRCFPDPQVFDSPGKELAACQCKTWVRRSF